jgi:pyruvate/2-oxoglutarate dehydrogenase complex dihydrolipoamide dehydrogenase (E3) component
LKSGGENHKLNPTEDCMNEKTQKMQSDSGSKPEEYDLVILGSGAAGKLIAWTLAKKGMKTAVVERQYVGGACPNIACLPSKNVVHSAKVASYFRRSGEFGIANEQLEN